MIVSKQARQGDVLLTRKTSSPEGKKIESLTVAEGERTGHHHAFLENVALFRDDGTSSLTAVVAPGGASLAHQEHTTIAFSEGRFEVRRQRQYMAGMSVRVED